MPSFANNNYLEPYNHNNQSANNNHCVDNNNTANNNHCVDNNNTASNDHCVDNNTTANNANYSHYNDHDHNDHLSTSDHHDSRSPVQRPGSILDAQMQAFANSFLGQFGVKSVAYANNIAYGFSLTTSELQAALGPISLLNGLCNAVGIFTLQISDATCPVTPLPAQQCNVNVNFCALESLSSAGISSGTCTANGPLLPCLPSQVTSTAITNCHNLGTTCKAYGNNLLTPLTATKSVAQIQEDIATYALSNLCLAGTTVTLSDASCAS
ncbi:hypothetical protein HRR83_002454 [Exophiala dermatitidis]|nr:hypothetical protein HRR75_002318 [Exophiala dermatitidis]KAJ4524333.1 hypothetical protein HRR74_002531 [Exophiala dermatitidis]KAJ4555688.1 hypothetical protein HRR77_001618 [Exophiala dermatitidis]KAJ4556177.1 hypothetical protein HRR78_001835 [Exophiala dermatitidis]KAJ4568991.1 hypothetical protein HRR81_006649 [Exophiala dermatitidis]